MADLTGKPLPEQTWRQRTAGWVYWVLAMITWPATVRALKQAGAHRTGWMTWEIGPDDG